MKRKSFQVTRQFNLALSAPVVLDGNISPHKVSKFHIREFHEKYMKELRRHGWRFTKEYAGADERMKFEADSYAGTPTVEQPILIHELPKVSPGTYSNHELDLEVREARLNFYYFGVGVLECLIVATPKSPSCDLGEAIEYCETVADLIAKDYSEDVRNAVACIIPHSEQKNPEWVHRFFVFDDEGDAQLVDFIRDYTCKYLEATERSKFSAINDFFPGSGTSVLIESGAESVLRYVRMLNLVEAHWCIYNIISEKILREVMEITGKDEGNSEYRLSQRLLELESLCNSTNIITEVLHDTVSNLPPKEEAIFNLMSLVMDLDDLRRFLDSRLALCVDIVSRKRGTIAGSRQRKFNSFLFILATLSIIQASTAALEFSQGESLAISDNMRAVIVALIILPSTALLAGTVVKTFLRKNRDY